MRDAAALRMIDRIPRLGWVTAPSPVAALPLPLPALDRGGVVRGGRHRLGQRGGARRRGGAARPAGARAPVLDRPVQERDRQPRVHRLGADLDPVLSLAPRARARAPFALPAAARAGRRRRGHRAARRHVGARHGGRRARGARVYTGKAMAALMADARGRRLGPVLFWQTARREPLPRPSGFCERLPSALSRRLDTYRGGSSR